MRKKSSGMHIIMPAVTKKDLEKAEKRKYPPGRKCANQDCITILSSCNPGPYCLQCAGQRRKNGYFNW